MLQGNVSVFRVVLTTFGGYWLESIDVLINFEFDFIRSNIDTIEPCESPYAVIWLVSIFTRCRDELVVPRILSLLDTRFVDAHRFRRGRSIVWLIGSAKEKKTGWNSPSLSRPCESTAGRIDAQTGRTAYRHENVSGNTQERQCTTNMHQFSQCMTPLFSWS